MSRAEELVREAKESLVETFKMIDRELADDPNDDKREHIIAVYTAAFAVNFTDLIGKTRPWVKSDEAKRALDDNQECEQRENHIDMLFDFADSCGVQITERHHKQVEEALRDIRDFMRKTQYAGLYGLVILAILENVSEDFIPRLEKIARALGSTNLEYTQKHGPADIEHSQDLNKALDAEARNGYSNVARHTWEASNLTVDLIKAVFAFS